MSEQQIAAFRQRINQMKYRLMDDLFDGDEDELNYSAVFMDLKHAAIDSINKLRRHMHPPIEVQPVFDGSDLDVDVRCVLMALAAIFEILSMLSKNYDTKLCAIVIQLQNLTNNNIQEMFASGMLETAAAVIREGVMNLNKKRLHFVQSYKQEILYCIKCCMLSFRQNQLLIRKHFDACGLADVLEVAVKHIMDETMMIETLLFAQRHPSTPSSLLMAIYTHVSGAASTAAKILISPECLTAHITKCYRWYKRDPSDGASAIQCMYFATQLSQYINTRSWLLHEKSKNSLKQFVFCILDVMKIVTGSTSHTAQLISKVNAKFMSDIFRLLAYIFSKRPDLLSSFLVKFVPVSVLSSKPDLADQHLVALFRLLEESHKFITYMAAMLTDDLKHQLEKLVTKQTFETIDMKSRLFSKALEMDTDSRFVDNMSGCFIVSPGLLRNGSHDIWVDVFDMEICLYSKPENPYTREPLSPEDFLSYQIEKKDLVDSFNKDRKGFLQKCKMSDSP